MRTRVAVIVLGLLAACTKDGASAETKSSTGPETVGTSTVKGAEGPAAWVFAPATFRSDLERLVSSKKWPKVIAYLDSADPKLQARHASGGYMAVAEDMIVLPGFYPDIDYDAQRDWVFPGTSDTRESGEWQLAATEFAKQYNLLR